jgi:tetratricopeptide (TPR) repeat protein
MPTYTAIPVAARFVRPARLLWRAGLLGLGLVVMAAPHRGVHAQMAMANVTKSGEPSTYLELWQAAAAAVDQGTFERNEAGRTALYTKATNYARRAVALNPGDPEGHFHLSRAIGRTALAAGPRERVKYGIEVREEALAALKLAPRHPGALHVMGVWHAEIMRLNGISRTVARAFLGGQVFGTASWAEALRHLELAVEIEPARLVHRLDLARIYRDLDRINDARAAYRAAIAAPASDPNDAVYRQHANDELKKLR